MRFGPPANPIAPPAPAPAPVLTVAPVESDGDFTQNWTKGRTYWAEMFERSGFKGRPNLRFLEIGCFEGRATLWLLENVLTHETSRIDVIDTFEGSPEFEKMGVDGYCLARFVRNVAAHATKVKVLQGTSGEHLRHFTPVETYDFIYVDGSHSAPDVLMDAVLAWPLLKPGGLLAFDDYRWQLERHEHTRPAIAIDAFLGVLGWQMQLVHEGAQLAVQKL